MINSEATTKKHCKDFFWSNNYIQNPGNTTGEKNYMALDLRLQMWNLQTKENERKECPKFTTGKDPKRGKPQLKGGWGVNGMKPERTCLGQTPLEVTRGMPRRGRTRTDSSIGCSQDVGQCVISSKRWVGIRGADNSKAKETRAKLKKAPPESPALPKDFNLCAIFYPAIDWEECTIK